MPNIRKAPFGARILVAGLLGMAVATPAMADDSQLLVNRGADTRSVEVQYSDLNLDTAYGRDTLEIRVNNAAESVCDITGGSRWLDKSREALACFNQAKQGALAQLAAEGVPVETLAGG